jgi:hypothetical protein
MKRSLILMAWLVFGLMGCNREAGSDGGARFIATTGTVKLFGGQLTLAVVETPDGGINYTLTRGTSTAGPATPLIRKGSGWFLYAASPEAVWMHDGATNVLLIEMTDNGSKFTGLSVVPDLLQRAPAPFVDRLPPAMKK